MKENRDRLVDATRRLIETGTSEDEALKSMTDIGVSQKEAKGILEDAKVEARLEGTPPGEINKKEPAITPDPQIKNNENDFWDSKEGSFFVSEGKKKKENKSKTPEKKVAFSDMFKFNANTTKENKKNTDSSTLEQSYPEKPKFENQSDSYAYTKMNFRESVPLLVSDFDKLVDRKGFKRGDTVLISGGAGTGKTTFGMQFLYNGAKAGFKCVYLTLEETAEKIKENMMENFGWDLDSLEKQGLLAIIKIDPLTIARAVEATLTKERGGLYIEFEQFDLPFQFNLPFKPDRVVVDSLSALSIAFMENAQGYRQYLRHLFETLEKYQSINLVFGETEQSPKIYSRMGVEEFLADGVIVFYNIKVHNTRENALEILKLRSSAHSKKLVPYKITSNGFEIYIDEEIFREE